MATGLRNALLLAIGFVAPWMQGVVQAGPAIVVVTGDRGGAYDEAEASFRHRLRDNVSPADISVIDWDALNAAALRSARVIVTFGVRAAAAVDRYEPATPVLNTLLPRAAFERLHGSAPNEQVSAIFLDQPAERQIAALTEALPGWRLALIAGPRTRNWAADLAKAAALAGVTAETREVDDEREIYPALQTLLSEPALLIAVPDPQIFNSNTIQNILLTSYRHKSPLMGFSPAYVRAGALLALYSTPSQIGAQAADVAHAAMKGERLPGPNYPTRFELSINATVARSLGITLESAHALTERLMRREALQ